MNTTESSSTDSQEKEQKKTVSSLIVETVVRDAELFHDSDGNAYATFSAEVDGVSHFETWPLDSKQFQHWIGHKLYKEQEIMINKNSLSDAINVLTGKALYEGVGEEVFIRTAKVGDTYYLDPAIDTWHLLEIKPGKYKMVGGMFGPPVKFRRTSAMREWAIPKEGEYRVLCELLSRHINIKGDDLKLVIVWLIEALRPDTPYPILELIGEQGSAKSTTQDRLRDIADPNRVNLRAAPRSIEDIFVGAANNHVVSYNNLSHISKGQSDAYCSLATGGGHAGRKLYTNLDESITEVKRPVVYNGIGTLATRADLVDRSIRISLPVIDSKQRKSDSEIRAAFEGDLPLITGALLDTFSKSLEILPTIQLEELPRMADFALLGQAVSKLFGWKPSFVEIYKENQKQTIERTIESSPVASAVIQLLTEHKKYSGTIKELWQALDFYKMQHEAWPQSYKGLADALRRHAPALRSLGIEVEHDPQRYRDGYRVSIFYAKQCSQPTQCSQNNPKREHREPCEHQRTKDFMPSNHGEPLFQGSESGIDGWVDV